MKSAPEGKFQFAILIEPFGRIDGLSDTATIEWLSCKHASGSVYEFYKDNSIVASLNLEKARFELHNLLGIIVVGTADVFDAIKSAWSQRLPSLTIAFRLVPTFDPAAIVVAALECMSADLMVQRQHSGRAVLDLANYRRVFERLQRSFTRLEEHVGRQSLLGAMEIFEYPPDTVTINDSPQNPPDQFAAPSSRSLTQYVPVDSSGFSSFSIYISAKPESSGEPLRVTLKALETGQVHGVWSIGAAQAQVGWIELALNYAIDESALSLVVIVDWPPHTDGWELALGPPHPFREFSACTSSGRYLEAPLALRVFARLPGVRVQATTSALRPIDAPHSLVQFVPYEIYATVAQVSPRHDDGKPALVSYDPNLGCITVHPHEGGIATVGRMHVVVPKNAWRVSAQIQLAHEHASPTQFALLLCAPDDGGRELERLNEMTVASPGFSGWRVVSPLEKKNISAFMPAGHQERMWMYLATRQAPKVSPDFAWARFTRLEFDILPASLSQESESDTLASVLRSVSVSAELGERPSKLEIPEAEPNAKPV
jgi:Family of unknown function (DUF6212)